MGRLVEIARRDFFENQQHNSRGDPKRFWRNIASVIPNNKKGKMDISLIDASTDHDIKISPSKTPDFINSYFANIGKD